MEYISTREAAKLWQVNIRVIQNYCKESRIPGAKKYGITWLIPKNAKKPADLRRKVEAQKEEISQLIYIPTAPLPRSNPDSILSMVDDIFVPILFADLSYRRGNSEPAKTLWKNSKKDESIIIEIAALATAAAISTGDYKLFNEINNFIIEKSGKSTSESDRLLLMLPQVIAAVSMALPDMTPRWLKDCDFTNFNTDMYPFLLYLHVLHLRNIGDYSGMLAMARSILILKDESDSFTWMDVYLGMTCASASYNLGDMEQSKKYLKQSLDLGMPHGFISPFADHLWQMGGTLEFAINQYYPEYYRPTLALWNNSIKNWMSFHNAFTQDNITTLLTPQEYHVARLLSHGFSYKKAGEKMHLSISRIKHIMSDVYAKLSIKNKRELAKYIF